MLYSDLIKQASTGDILLCHGTNWISDIIQDVTGGQFSHVAVFVVLDQELIDFMKEYGWTNVDSANVGDLWIFEEWEGVGFQGMPANQKIATYDKGACSYGISPVEVRSQEDKVIEVIKEYISNPALKNYEYIDLLKVGESDLFGIKFNLAQDTGGGVCSLLVQRVYSNCGKIYLTYLSPSDYVKLVAGIIQILLQ